MQKRVANLGYSYTVKAGVRSARSCTIGSLGCPYDEGPGGGPPPTCTYLHMEEEDSFSSKPCQHFRALAPANDEGTQFVVFCALKEDEQYYNPLHGMQMPR